MIYFLFPVCTYALAREREGGHTDLSYSLAHKCVVCAKSISSYGNIKSCVNIAVEKKKSSSSPNGHVLSPEKVHLLPLESKKYNEHQIFWHYDWL